MDRIALPSLVDELARAGPKGLSRSAVPEAELDLCLKWGFPITRSEQRVWLSHNADLLAPVLIETEASSTWGKKLRVEGFLQLDSTNEEALTRARTRGIEDVVLIYAESQTKGRGRKGRRWHCRQAQGISCSMILKPKPPLRHWPLLALVSSVAVADAISELQNEAWIPKELKVDLKWPNDVILGGKKTAGILLETVQTPGGGNAAVLGVGINVGLRALPKELETEATSVSIEAGVSVPRRWVLRRFLHHFYIGYQRFQRMRNGEIIDQWSRRSSMWRGTPIWILDASGRREAVTIGLSESGALLVRAHNGRTEALLAADVTVRSHDSSKAPNK